MLEKFDELLPTKQEAARDFGELKAFLKNKRNLDRKEMRKHNIDIVIAATAIYENATIISGDDIYKDLAECKTNLKSENWIKYTNKTKE